MATKKETLKKFMENYKNFDWKNGTVILLINNQPHNCKFLFGKYKEKPIKDWAHDENTMVITM